MELNFCNYMHFVPICIYNFTSILLFPLSQGEGWEEGAVRSQLSTLMEKHRNVETKPEYTYAGLSTGMYEHCGAEYLVLYDK